MGLTNCKPSNHNQVHNIRYSNISEHINNQNNDVIIEYGKDNNYSS